MNHKVFAIGKGLLIMTVCFVSIFLSGGTRADAMDHAVAMNITVDKSDEAGTKFAFDVKQGSFFKVELLAASGTGYEWDLNGLELTKVEVISRTVEPQSSVPGGKVCITYVLQAKYGVTGKEEIRFLLRRAWEPKEMAAQYVTCEVNIRDK